MQDYEKLGVFYLGRSRDKESLLLYDSRDLVTHAVCVGMTGSGKTGLCVSLLEEAAIDGIPAIIIDPKGDLSNLLLTFPELRPEDFAPWVNEDEARRKGISRDELAKQHAEMWRTGLEKWHQQPERIKRLRESADFAIYTPGSEAGIPVSVVRSFDAPPPEALEDRELIRDRISGTATALLALLGIEADPIQSREHILLSSIFDHAWKNGQNLDIAGIIQQIQTPPVDRIGVLELESFYPAKERFPLAMALNNLLASPGFEAWLHGEPLDVGHMFHTPTGKPRHSIFSIAHLGDAERMFFVSLLLNQILTWMRAQPGTTSLRALVYMDEIFGYFPPVANPPSKMPLLTLLKQARAFGVGVVLATQNPVDLDYKGLANAGTWFIGRLQTERDKARVIEGLEGAASGAGRKFDRGEMERRLAGLGNRVFLMNNVHEDAPEVFETRWALSYLAGPMTRSQIKTLMEPRKQAAQPTSTSTTARGPAIRTSAKTAPRPVLPPDISQHFIPARSTRPQQAALLYQPMLLAATQVRFSDVKSKVDLLNDFVYMTAVTDDAVPVKWEEAVEARIDPSDLENAPVDSAEFSDLPGPAGKPKSYAAWSKECLNWLFTTQKLDLYRSPGLKQMSQPGESEGDFRIRLQQAAHEQRDAIAEKLKVKYGPKKAQLEERMRRAEQALQKEAEQAKDQKLQSVLSIGTGLLGAFLGRKTISAANVGRVASAARSAGRIRKESSDIGRAQENIDALRQQMEELEAQFQAEIDKLEMKVDPTTEVFETISIRPKKTHISVRLFTLVWAPCWKTGEGEANPAWE